jgi:RecA-family ATPase
MYEGTPLIALRQFEPKVRSSNADQSFTLVNAKSWDWMQIPQRRWLVRNRVPIPNVTLLQGDGGTGKTTIALQLCVAVDQNLDWLGAVIDEPGPSMFLSAEEDEDEIKRRLFAILDHRGLAFHNLNNLYVFGEPDDPILGALRAKSGGIEATPLYHRLDQAVCDIQPKLLVIEAAADVFGGNENDRGQVRKFLSLMRRLGQRARSDTAKMLLQHPSQSGMASGSGNSGSTQWSNSGRSRLYFTAPKTNTGEDGDDTLVRELKVMKANYGPKGEVVKVRYEHGVFVLHSGPSTIERAAMEAQIDEIFLRCLDMKRAQGFEVVATTGNGFAPKIFEDMPEARGRGLKSRVLAASMERLLSGGRIKVEVVGGPPSKPKRGLVRSC